jgi:hypothetical protein
VSHQTKSVVRKLHGMQSVKFEAVNQYNILGWIEERGGSANYNPNNRRIDIKYGSLGVISVYDRQYIVWNPDGNKFNAYNEKRYAFLYTET